MPRKRLRSAGNSEGIPQGLGPLPVDARSGEGGDRTPTFGIVGMGGGAVEWNRDAFAPMTSSCWAASGLRSPGCELSAAVERSLRGGGWGDNVGGLVVATRRSEAAWSSAIGFRCVRPGEP